MADFYGPIFICHWIYGPKADNCQIIIQAWLEKCPSNQTLLSGYQNCSCNLLWHVKILHYRIFINVEFHQKKKKKLQWRWPNSGQLMEGTIWLTDFSYSVNQSAYCSAYSNSFQGPIIEQRFVLRNLVL